jgi:hypothetical protein
VDAFNASYGLICCELAPQLRPRCDHCHYCSGQRRAARKCSGGTSTVQLQSEQPIHIGTAHTVPKCLDSVFCSSALVRSRFVPASLSFEANLATGVPRFNALMDHRPAEFPHQAVDPRQKRGLRPAAPDPLRAARRADGERLLDHSLSHSPTQKRYQNQYAGRFEAPWVAARRIPLPRTSYHERSVLEHTFWDTLRGSFSAVSTPVCTM